MEIKSSAKKGIILLIPFILSFALPIWFTTSSPYFLNLDLSKELDVVAVLSISGFAMTPFFIVSIIQKLKMRQL